MRDEKGGYSVTVGDSLFSRIAANLKPRFVQKLAFHFSAEKKPIYIFLTIVTIPYAIVLSYYISPCKRECQC